MAFLWTDRVCVGVCVWVSGWLMAFLWTDRVCVCVCVCVCAGVIPQCSL